MGNKNRVRGVVQKYTTGLGDGHVEDNGKKSIEDEEALVQQVVQARWNHNHMRNPNSRYHRGKDDIDTNVIFTEGELKGANKNSQPNSVMSKHGVHGIRRSSIRRNDPWDAPAFYLVAATVIVLVSAVVLHLIAMGNEHNQAILLKHRKILKKKLSRQKKKTDEWNEDAKEEELLSESLRGGSAMSDSENAVDDIVDQSLPVLYYPYQSHMNQYHRHRKNSASNVQFNTATVNTSSHSQQQQQPLQSQQQVQQPTNASNRSYYLNQSGSAVIAGNIFNNNVANSNMGASCSVHHQTVVQEGYCPPSPIPHQKYGAMQQTETNQQHPAIIPSSIVESRRSSRHARPLSSSKLSFESLTDDILDSSRDGIDTESTPENHQNRLFLNTDIGSIPKPPIVQHSKSEELTPKMKHQSKLLTMADLIENTPRIVNGRQCRFPTNPPVPEDSPLHVDNTQSVLDSTQLLPLHQPSFESTIDMTFATSPNVNNQRKRMEATTISPPKRSPNRQKDKVMAMPLVPSLGSNVVSNRPPKSVHLDQLQLYQLMESGNVSHWEERVAEESRQLQNRIFPDGVISDNILDSVMAASPMSPTGTHSDTIPSNDPRKGIHHKREVLTDDTDAAASLQGSIDFTELKLIEVIGGGGFGQVWKAIWRETPVAVKVLTGSAQSKTVPRPVLEEFAAEINLLKGMRHPNICLYMGACLKPPNRAIITELAANGSLWDALRLPLTPPHVPCDGLTRMGWPDILYEPDSRYGAPPTLSSKPLTLVIPCKGTWHWDLVKRVACGAARGLCYLHGGKIPVLHRDLKSANILLDESYTAKVCDFGLSRLKAQERSMTGNCGTVQWMAPEVLANQSYNEKADVYSFGVILWELLTRQCPYDKMTPIQCALAVLNRNQRPDIPKWCPPSFQALIRACWKKEPDERPTFPQILSALDSMP